MVLLVPSIATWADSLPDVVDRLRPSVVGVGAAYPPQHSTPKGGSITFSGTGFVVGDGQHAVTSLHVVPQSLDDENGQALAVFTGRGTATEARSAQVVATDPPRGLALLRFRGSTLPALQFGDSDLIREGQEVAFTGFPIGMVLGLRRVTHRGIVSSIAPLLPPASNAGALTADRIKAVRQAFNVLQLDATSYPGNSGSPVYSPDSGRVLGILSSTQVQQPGTSAAQRPPGISFAIPAKFVEQLIAQGLREP